LEKQCGFTYASGAFDADEAGFVPCNFMHDTSRKIGGSGGELFVEFFE
jgi:hypothetical protein